MEITTRTRTVLENFADINNRLVFQQGNVIRTASDMRTVFAMANLDTSIEDEFRIYNLTRFINCYKLFDTPTITVNPDFVTFQQGDRKMRYSCAPEKDVPIPFNDIIEGEVVESFTINADMIKEILKFAKFLKIGELAMEADGEHLYLKVQDFSKKKGRLKDTFSREVLKTTKRFVAVLKIDTFLIIPGDYHVEIQRKELNGQSSGFVKFKGIAEMHYLTYWIGIDNASTTWGS